MDAISHIDSHSAKDNARDTFQTDFPLHNFIGVHFIARTPGRTSMNMYFHSYLLYIPIETNHAFYVIQSFPCLSPNRLQTQQIFYNNSFIPIKKHSIFQHLYTAKLYQYSSFPFYFLLIFTSFFTFKESLLR